MCLSTWCAYRGSSESSKGSSIKLSSTVTSSSALGTTPCTRATKDL